MTGPAAGALSEDESRFFDLLADLEAQLAPLERGGEEQLFRAIFGRVSDRATPSDRP